MDFIIIFLIIIVLVGVFVGATYLNQQTAIPEGCKDAYLEAQSCKTCTSHTEGSSCGFNNTLEFLKEVKL